ncbi:MAG: glycosyltransferase family 2 protein [Candidatus Shapirobacteria bacterium]|nr:glycosyltransferase family 2 protein [Candidatus Shapirobacteria bacterium]
MATINQNKKITIDILIPTYNGSKYIFPTLKSILFQSYPNFRIIVGDDASKDNTVAILKKIKDKRLIIHDYKNNLGYSDNLERCRQLATADIIYLMGQDDIMANDTLLNTIKAFSISNNIGAVTRPYFWFDKDITVPVRAKGQLNPKKDSIIRISDNPKKVIKVFETLDQLSGLAYRRKYMDMPFHQDIFPCHIYPFASIFKKHPVVFLKDYNIAVRISSSQTRKLSSIYNKSPMQSWVEMVSSVYSEKKFEKIKKYLIADFIAKNYVGLVQLRNYAKYSYFLREIWYLIKFKWQNIFNSAFWFFSIGCIIVPPSILIPLVDWYKNYIYSQTLKHIKFNYSYGNK